MDYLYVSENDFDIEKVKIIKSNNNNVKILYNYNNNIYKELKIITDFYNIKEINYNKYIDKSKCKIKIFYYAKIIKIIQKLICKIKFNLNDYNIDESKSNLKYDNYNPFFNIGYKNNLKNNIFTNMKNNQLENILITNHNQLESILYKDDNLKKNIQVQMIIEPQIFFLDIDNYNNIPFIVINSIYSKYKYFKFKNNSITDIYKLNFSNNNLELII